MTGPCQLCERETALTRHHLVPQCRHHNKWNKKSFDRRAIKTDLLLLCAGCHRHLHALITEKELERRFHDLTSLRTHPEVEKFVAWLRTKPPGFKPPSSRHPTKVGMPLRGSAWIFWKRECREASRSLQSKNRDRLGRGIATLMTNANGSLKLPARAR